MCEKKKELCEICKEKEGKGFIIVGDNAECIWVCPECAEKYRGL